jgi:hypothetical protein
VGKEHSLSTVERDKREQCVRAPSPQMCGERERETDREKEEREREREKKIALSVLERVGCLCGLPIHVL